MGCAGRVNKPDLEPHIGVDVCDIGQSAAGEGASVGNQSIRGGFGEAAQGTDLEDGKARQVEIAIDDNLVAFVVGRSNLPDKVGSSTVSSQAEITVHNDGPEGVRST